MRKALLAAAAALAAGQAMACYTVYDRNNQIVYNAQTPPVDMSQPLHETLPQKYPGGHLVFGSGADCPLEPPVRQMRAASTNGRSPLLTDAATAQALGLPHTIIASGVAMLPDRPDTMRPGVVLAESGLPAPEGPDTRMMGAGPARPNTATMGGPPARQGQRSSPVITEMHNPPLTAVQPGVSRSR
jgi:hypothetical protein